MRPLVIRQVAWIPQVITIVFRSVLKRPHRPPPGRIRPHPLNPKDSADSRSFETDTNALRQEGIDRLDASGFPLGIADCLLLPFNAGLERTVLNVFVFANPGLIRGRGVPASDWGGSRPVRFRLARLLGLFAHDRKVFCPAILDFSDADL